MKISKHYIDFFFLVFLGGMLTLAFYYHFSRSIEMPVNTYFGVVAWAISFIAFFLVNNRTFLFIITLLALFTFNVINFSVATATISLGSNEHPFIEPLALLMLLIYVPLKRKSINELFKASPDDDKAKQETEIDFYYKKFNDDSTEDLDNLMKHFADYPPAAQIALTKIKSERK
jgi:hypothetical protein